jgi:hypothetical protein
MSTLATTSAMNNATSAETRSDSARYARCIDASRRVRWDIERDVIRGRGFDFDRHFLPEGLSRVGRLDFLTPLEQRLLSQIQGRTYANIFGLVERFITVKMLEVSREHAFGDQIALEALVRFTDEELKHQALFRQVEGMIAAGMPAGYEMVADANAVASAVLAASNWAVLALTCHIELFTQVHYRHSMEGHKRLCELYKDVFLFHWKEESQHAILDELEWRREDARLTDAQRDIAVSELLALVQAVDGIIAAQAQADAHYFLRIVGRALTADESHRLADGLLDAYRWQYLVSGWVEPRFQAVLGSMITRVQQQRIERALAPLTAS